MLDPISSLGLIYSRENFAVSLGGHMHPCDTCGKLQPHELLEIIRKDVGILKVHKDTPLHKRSRCEVCDSLSIHHKKSKPVCLEYWGPNSDYRDYALRSGYDTADQEHEIITPRSAEALLKAVTASTAASADLTWKDYANAVLFFILSGIIAIMVFARSSDAARTDSNAAVFILLGIPAAGLLFALFFLIYRQKRRQLQTNHLKAYKERLEKLGLSSKAVISALPQSAMKDQSIYALVKPFV